MVGCQLVIKLLEAGYDFKAFISPKSIFKRPWINDIIPSDRAIRIDLRSKDLINRVISRMKNDRYTLVYIAGRMMGKNIYHVNYYGVKYLIDILGDRINRVIFISSILALGDSLGGEVISEDMIGRPATEYEWSKWDAERYIIDMAGRLGYSYAILRPVWIIGEYTINPDIILLSKLMKIHIMPIPVRKNLPIHLIYSGDLANAITCTLDSSKSGIYNIYGIRTTMYEFMNCLREILDIGRCIKLTIPKSVLKFGVRWMQTLRYLLLAPREISMDLWLKDFKYKPKTGLREMLSKAIEWLENMKLI